MNYVPRDIEGLRPASTAPSGCSSRSMIQNLCSRSKKGTMPYKIPCKACLVEAGTI